MIPASDSFAAAIREGYEVAAKAELIDYQGNVLRELPIETGSVNLDGNAATRAGLSLTLAPDVEELDELLPDRFEDPLAPAGNEIVAYRGVTYLDNNTEYVQLGVFPIDEFSGDDDAGGVNVSISALDRSSRIIDAVFEEAGSVAAGTNALQQIIDLISAVEPAYEFTFTAADTAVTLPDMTYEVNDDRWDFCRGCAEAAGVILYFDNLGRVAITPPPMNLTPILTIAEGDVLLTASKRWGKENAVNRVYVEGDTIGEDPVVGEAKDESPNSPTRYGGPFGRHTFTYSSEWIKDEDQANDVAQTILAQKVGSTQEIGFSSLPDPRLEPFDVVRITRERLKIDEIHVIDSLSIPLDFDGDMSGSTRAVRVV